MKKRSSLLIMGVLTLLHFSCKDDAPEPDKGDVTYTNYSLMNLSVNQIFLPLYSAI